MSKHKRTWLSLSEAAAILDVHITTLRRWADNGDIATIMTPGGHRRFDPHEVERFAAAQRDSRPKGGVVQVLQHHALQQVRQGVVQHQMPWLDTAPDHLREQSRQLGQRLLGLTMTYAALSDDSGSSGAEEQVLEEVRTIGHAYADHAQALGLSLTAAVQTLLYYRDTLIESAVAISGSVTVRPDLHARLIRRINTLLNIMQLTLITSYQGDSSQS